MAWTYEKGQGVRKRAQGGTWGRAGRPSYENALAGTLCYIYLLNMTVDNYGCI